MKRLFMMVGVLLVFSQAVWADDLQEVSNLVKEKITLVMDLLRDAKLEKKARNGQVVVALVPVLDFELMAKLSLGKDSWESINPQQQDQYTELFVSRIQESLLEKLELYTDEQVAFRDAVRDGKKINVVTDLVSKDDKIEMLFKFSKSKKHGWRAYDLEIIGVSVIQTYRSQFDAVIKKGGIALLLEELTKSGKFKMSEDKKTMTTQQ